MQPVSYTVDKLTPLIVDLNIATPMTTYQCVDETGNGISCFIPYWLGLHPLSEIVNSYHNAYESLR
jgi:hypothetical protein